jgi:hypothetical protein
MTRGRKVLYAGGGLLLAGVGLCVWFLHRGGEHVAPVVPTLLLERVDPGKYALNTRQARVLARIKKSPVAVNWKLSRLNRDGLKSLGGAVVMHLAREESLEMVDPKLRKGERVTHLNWKGGRATEACHLTISEEGTTSGLIYTRGKVFAVEPLGDDLIAVVELDQRKFAGDHPKSFDQIEEKPIREVKPGQETGTVVITVLVAYTRQVDDLQGNVKNLINSAVDLANVSYMNSQIDIRLDLVDTVKVDYPESATHETDLARFKGKNDGFMDEIHQRRDASKADVCVLLIDNDQYCGLSADIMATEDTAFAVVHHACALDNLSLAHEIGHLQGARHNPEADPTVDPKYRYNHGYLSTQGNWRTIMAYPTDDQPNRLPYWSNPAVSFDSEAMGVKDQQDNARMLTLSASAVSQFRK